MVSALVFVVSVEVAVVVVSVVAGVVTVVESVEFVSVLEELPLQAVKKAATVKTTNKFFILFNIRFLKNFLCQCVFYSVYCIIESRVIILLETQTLN